MPCPICRVLRPAGPFKLIFSPFAPPVRHYPDSCTPCLHAHSATTSTSLTSGIYTSLTSRAYAGDDGLGGLGTLGAIGGIDADVQPVELLDCEALSHFAFSTFCGSLIVVNLCTTFEKF